MTNIYNNKLELLAPAGKLESLYAAVNNGCDAVYLGGNKFSARAYASNFDNENMKKAVDYCHSYGVKVYVTMNTLLKENEIKEAIKYVGYLYEIGVDALIIQDLGLTNLILQKYKDFEIHASTQLTIHNGPGALYFKNKGFKRIVLSRELSFNEIEYISKEMNIETEIFIHGALCVCYSGKCLMSSMIGGRSGNRGRCAQPCRMEYTIDSDNMGQKKGYLLSPKDMCTIDDIKDIIKSNAASLKIEGRMKRPEYVAGVVKNYREAIDKELFHKKYNIEKGKRELMQLFNREGFSKAYLKKNIGKDMMSFSFPKNTGINIGKILPDGTITLNEDIALGDGIRNKDKGFILSKILSGNKEVQNAKRGERVKLFPTGYKKNDILFRTSSKELNDTLEESIKPYLLKKSLMVDACFVVGKNASLKTIYNDKEYIVEGEMVEEAVNKPLSKEKIIDNLQKSGDYPFKIDKINFTYFSDGFMRVSSINALRRSLFEKIINDLTSEKRRSRGQNKDEYLDENKLLKRAPQIDYLFTCTKSHQVEKLALAGYKNIGIDIFSRTKDGINIDIIDKYKNINFYILAPEIIKGEIDSVISTISKLKNKIKGIITSNAALIETFKDDFIIIGDYKLNVFNSKAFEFYGEDINMITLSVELNKREIKELLNNLSVEAKDKSVIYIYGKIENMVSEYCAIGSTFGGKTSKSECNGSCMKDEFVLVDRMKERFKIITDKYCRSHIYNSVPINLIKESDEIKDMGISTLRLDFKDESEEEVLTVIDMIKNNDIIDSKNYTKGHYKRGVE